MLKYRYEKKTVLFFINIASATDKGNNTIIYLPNPWSRDKETANNSIENTIYGAPILDAYTSPARRGRAAKILITFMTSKEPFNSAAGVLMSCQVSVNNTTGFNAPQTC